MSRRCNGFGTLVSKGDGKPWLARWMFNRKIYTKSTGETDRKKAEKVLERLTRPYRESCEEDVIANLEIQLQRLKSKQQHEKLHLNSLWPEFESMLWKSDITENTKNVYGTTVKHFTKWMLHKTLYINDIKEQWFDEYFKSLSETVGQQTYNLKVVVLKRMWKDVSKKFGLDEKMLDNYKTKKSAKSQRRTLTDEEIKQVLENAKTKDLKTLLLLGIYTGLRISDCALLKWENVNFGTKTISLVPQKTKKHCGMIHIPMHEVLEKALREMTSESEYVSEKNATEYKHGSLSGIVISLFKKCGIETSRKVGNRTELVCGFHSLRHTFVSNAINSGMSPLLVQRIVGHSAVDMTEHYFHANAAKAAEGIAQLPDYITLVSQLTSEQSRTSQDDSFCYVI